MGEGSHIGRVRGLGSAKAGTHHWWLQRVTALANFLLVIWLIASLTMLPMHDYQTMTDWLRQPLVAVPALLLVVSVLWHFRLGFQVFIEDYVHNPGGKFASLLLLNGYTIGAAAVALFCLLKISFGG